MNHTPPDLEGLEEALARFEGTAEKLGLTSLGQDLSVGDRIALLDATIRRNLAYAIMMVFGAVNLSTLIFVYFLAQADQRDLSTKIIEPADRIVNAHVLMTILGATTVQLGTAMVIMARYVFRPPVDQTQAGDE